MAHLVFDIETAAIPFEEFDAAQQEFLTRNCKTDEERQRQIELMSLNPLTARVASIGMLHVPSDREPYGCVYSSGDEPAEETLSDGTKWRMLSEREMLEKWWEIIGHGQPDGGFHLISFNGRNFDCPFLMLRSALLRVRPSRNLMQGTRWKYMRHTDLAEELTFHTNERSGAMRKFNFDFYCKSFGIPTPKGDGITGHDVPEFYDQGRHREIAEYCMRDVRATWELFKVWKEYLSEEAFNGLDR